MMKNRKQKIYVYLTIIALSIILGIASYPFHKSQEFQLFKSLTSKEEYRISRDDVFLNHNSDMGYLEIFQTFNRIEKEYSMKINNCPQVQHQAFISFEDLNFLIDSECVAVIDARSGLEINEEKISEDKKMIPNALSIPVEDIELADDVGYFEDSDNQDLLLDYEDQIKTINYIDRLPRNATYIVYCGSKECDKSENLAYYLINNFKFSTVAIYKGGWQEWKEKVND